MIDFKPTILYTAKCCLGAKEGDDRHKLIIDIYNLGKEKNQYKVTYKDPWCAAFVSALFISCGMQRLIPIEASCFFMKNKAASRGMLRDPKSYTPVAGDLILYKLRGKQTVSHVGIIDHVDDVNISVIEGNKNDSVSRRLITKSYPFIDSYIHVDYEVQTL